MIAKTHKSKYACDEVHDWNCQTLYLWLYQATVYDIIGLEKVVYMELSYIRLLFDMRKFYGKALTFANAFGVIFYP